MSRRKRERNRMSNDKAAVAGLGLSEVSIEPAQESEVKQLNVGLFRRTATLIRTHWVVSGIIALALFTTTVLALQYLDEDAKRQSRLAASERSALSKINPFLTVPPPPTPQLSKELIYAGSRLLAVEDANANAAPPADLAIWRPSTGVWWVMGGQGSQAVTQGWGLPTDKPVQGDYDGDGKTDFSVFRPSTGEWYVLRSSDGAWSVWTWGLSSDKLAPADYDGDGKTDQAVFRPSDTTWYIIQSSNQSFVYFTYGLSTDTPAPADYDGDGRADIAIWRSSNNTFYSINSSNNASAGFTFTQSSTEPVSADYDGDGRADYAIRNGNNWIIRNSSNPTTPVTILWQSSTDIAVQNDYDGDGKVDIATWRDSNGTWFIRQSSLIGQANELRQVQWGMHDDIPVPAFYRR
ncbi:MAG: FG-GAP repeat domain-containing protein [Pyrinomonadaceae bacterium]